MVSDSTRIRNLSRTLLHEDRSDYDVITEMQVMKAELVRIGNSAVFVRLSNRQNQLAAIATTATADVAGGSARCMHADARASGVGDQSVRDGHIQLLSADDSRLYCCSVYDDHRGAYKMAAFYCEHEAQLHFSKRNRAGREIKVYGDWAVNSKYYVHWVATGNEQQSKRKGDRPGK
jgi:hypothetical protein